MGIIKIGDFEMVIKNKDGVELDEMPKDLPVHDFEGNVVTLQEAKDGYMRQSDYTLKTQELGKMRDFLQNRVGVQSTEVDKGIAILNGLIDKVVELEDKGILDPATGEIKLPAGTETAEEIAARAALLGTAAPDNLTLESLPPEVKQTVEGLRLLSRDVGALMGYISREEVTKAYPNLSDQDKAWAHKMAASDPDRTPIQWAEELNKRLEARGQEAIDAHVKTQEAELAGKGHDRPGLKPDEITGELYEEEIVFSASPELHPDKKVVDPSVAAEAYMEEVFGKGR